MSKSLTAVFALFAVVAFAAANSDSFDRGQALTVHEWGTFTTVAGPDGKPVDWLPLAGPADLPCFVEHYVNRLIKYSASPNNPCLTYQEARTRLKGTVRMETPVIYFYSPREQTVSVRVDFPGGLVTEWYPKAVVTQVDVRERTLIEKTAGSRIEWRNVKILPGLAPDFPTEKRPSHYYAARETDAAPVHVNGQNEKFLFYRGVGDFPIPLTARVTDSGKIAIDKSSDQPVSSVVLFENRGGKIGYRVAGRVDRPISIDPPVLGADFSSLQRELETILIAEGLYTKEAQAMIETWRDSWFEEGARVFYMVPGAMVDSILPLKVDPKPAQANIARAFVGRIELITPGIIQQVSDAIARKDMATLAKHGRFLGPITDRITTINRSTIQPLLDAAFQSFLGDIAAGCK